MTLRIIVLAAALTGAAFGLAACGGGGAEVENSSTTVGQQLLDLQKAYEAGAISKEEYDDQREKILDSD
jgi:hypothetical protein